MIHQFQDKKRIIKRKKIIRNIIGFGIFVILCSLGFLFYTGKIFNNIGLPIWKTQKLVRDTASDLGYLVRTKSSVYKENENLIQENKTLINSMIDYQILKDENDQLKGLLGRTESKQSFILSNILTKPNRSLYDSIIIDVGINEGIQIGNKVYVDSKIPVGQISKVYNNTSLVSLYSNPDSVTEAVIDGSNATVSLVGRGGGNFEMTIPIDLSSEKGVLVTLPGVSSEVVAVIDGVVSSINEPVKKVILHSPVNIQNVKWVEVKK
jgi:rod shape-determining protein MreC